LYWQCQVCEYFANSGGPGPKGLLAPQNNFLEKIAKRFKGARKYIYLIGAVCVVNKPQMSILQLIRFTVTS
jgi:hypothetical protein